MGSYNYVRSRSKRRKQHRNHIIVLGVFRPSALRPEASLEHFLLASSALSELSIYSRGEVVDILPSLRCVARKKVASLGMCGRIYKFSYTRPDQPSAYNQDPPP